MEYKRCSNVEKALIHQAFLDGYSDYAVPMNIPFESFIERFFGPEGNSLENSFIALHHNQPVGLVLGGIRTFDGYKNLRCGTLCVSPAYRGTGVSHELFALFVQNALERKIERISLEVLTDNHRAIRFYEKQGFEIQNKLLYFSQTIDHSIIKNREIEHLMIEKVDLSVAGEIRDRLPSIHINWQNEKDYFLKDPTALCFAGFINQEIVGALVITETGKIYFIYVNEEERQKGYGSEFLLHAINELQLKKLSISMPDSIHMMEFLQMTGFNKDTIEQYEMVKMLH